MSLLQGREKVCYITGRVDNLHKHHIFSGPRRAASDKYGFWVWLTADIHNVRPESVHRNGWELRRRIQKDCERAFLKDHTMAEWMEMIGKNYLEEEEDEQVLLLAA